MLKIKVNDKYDYAVEQKNEKLLVNNKDEATDVRQLDESIFHIIRDFRSYNVEVVNFDKESKTAEIKVNGNVYTVTAKDQYDLLLDKLGMSALNSAKVSEVKAPMPGMVLRVFVNEGSQVQKGDNLFVLEAMKMENIIKSPADVTVKTLKIKAGDKVEKGQVLIVF
ncbi:biotin/lipoyl-containing protein [Mucilaginibacter ginsenosidivorans]|uniref:Biotin/lipoyl-binding protein n=1 Tax=Mucilaginibacter ginsenosidivorans TaxID=398053 RepID=A0A5B8UQ64_9SPHI|nr:acetyl-CoA carboxylase biotin carboxyl carrier protein subunit [Mucilaginibacter ginsenosidivorans]QEC61159.1 biotin/lipoyl-binding protein [Mucilaginibacter ginsenosidivorans]